MGLPETGGITPQLEKLMLLPRCGCPDILPQRLEAKWRKRELHWHVQSYVSGLSQQDQDDLLALAFKSWSDVADLKFTQRQGPAGADLLLSTGRGRGQGFDGPFGVLAWAEMPSGSDRPLQMRFDLDERWVRGLNDPGIPYLATAIHEIGHLLGLDHSRLQTAIMYASLMRFDRPQARDDIPRIQSLYGPPTAPVPPPPPPGRYSITLTSEAPIQVQP